MLPACFQLAEEIFPRVRAEAARRLVEDGASQSQAATVLGVSQAMVSKYVHQPPDQDPLVRRLSQEVGKEGASWCGLFDGSDALRDLVTAEAMLLAANPIDVVPEIGLNIARTPGPEAKPPEILAYPARLVRAQDRLICPVSPRAGASNHLAALLAAMASQGPVRALANLRGTTDVGEAARRIGLPVIDLGSGQDVETAFLAALDGQAKVLHHEGGIGLEACLYVGGTTAVEVAETILRIQHQVNP